MSSFSASAKNISLDFFLARAINFFRKKSFAISRQDAKAQRFFDILGVLARDEPVSVRRETF